MNSGLKTATRPTGVASGTMTTAGTKARCVVFGHVWQPRPDEPWRQCQRCGWDEQVGW